MSYLSPKEREEIQEFSKSPLGAVIRGLIENNLRELGDVNTLDKDPIESRKIAIGHLEKNLLGYFKETQEVDRGEVETYE